ncbi:hypothetical protein TNCV_5024661 [Trichonephila clavipes]|nr:hypothetical protein TNCV_5024661 [Trichonephila clavipes]
MQSSQPIENILETVVSPRKMGELERSIALDQFSHFLAALDGKLPPPTPIHVPAEKRPLEEKSLPFSKKRSKLRITPVMRRVSRRPELPMAPVEIPQVAQPPVLIPDVSEPVQISV